MKTGEIIAISIFGVLVVAAFVASIRQGARHKRHVAEYAARHGWIVSERADDHLMALLEEAAPNEYWTPSDVMLVEQAPQRVLFFSYKEHSKTGRIRPWYGQAFLAEHRTGRPASPVWITPRVPGFDKLMGGGVEVGSAEFRHEFTVECEDEGAAQVTVNEEIQRILLEHAADRAWKLTVTITAKCLLVESTWAKPAEEWDYLFTLGRKLRAALR